MPKATNKGSDFAPIPAAVQHAVCYQVIDIGTQPSFGNYPARRKVKIVWELPNEKIEVKAKEGNGSIEMPRSISKDYTLSTDTKANLRHDLEAWRGKAFTADEIREFEVGSIVGANCQLSIIHKPGKGDKADRVYANIAAIMPLAKGAVKLSPENQTLVYDLPASGEITFPAQMPEWIQNQIKNSEEYIDRVNGRHKNEPTEDQKANIDPSIDEDVPF